MNDKFKYSDEKLILRFQEGDINAYNELVKRYKDRLLNFVLRYFNNVEQAEDVVQDTLIKLYTHASYYKNVAKFSTWIFTIAKNNALTELRKNKRKKTDSLWTDDGQVIDINSKEESLDSKVQNEIAIDQLNKFLDEIPEMSLDAQKILLRVLDTATFTRLGGNEVLTVDVHIIAATNRDIVKAVAEKEFREDIYYHLKGMMRHLPPLRERPEDIAPLVSAFIDEFSTEYRKDLTGITWEALARLEQAAWPGNIRQLRSTIQTAVALATADSLESKDFPEIYPEFVEPLISIWQTLPPETRHAIWNTLHREIQHIIIHELSKQTAGLLPNLSVSNMPQTIEESASVNIKNMNRNQILRTVAQKRIKQYPSLHEAAESLNIDIRTLQKYAQWKESDE